MPTCMRCSKLGLECLYTPAFTKKSPQNEPRQQFLLPKGTSPIYLPCPLIQQPCLLQLSSTESTYYDIFRSYVTDSLRVHVLYHPSLLNTILRESFQDEVVKMSILSIGALSQSYHQIRLCTDHMGHQAASSTSLNSYKHAIRYYNTAVSIFRTRMADEKLPLPSRIILTVSVLFVILETMLGDTLSVDKLVSSMLYFMGNDSSLKAQSISQVSQPRNFYTKRFIKTKSGSLISKISPVQL
jgi:hypothetical protein